jgi:hypothetical protein
MDEHTSSPSAAVMLAALFLLYRIAYPEPAATKKGGEAPEKEETVENETVGKSRFVRPPDSHPQPTPATSLNPEKQDGKANIFALGNGKTGAVIPSERFNEIFGEEHEEPEPENLDIPQDETEEPEADEGEESEDLRQMLEQEQENPEATWMKATIVFSYNL